MTVDAPQYRAPQTRIFVGRSEAEIARIHELVGGPKPVEVDTYLDSLNVSKADWHGRAIRFAQQWRNRPLVTLAFILPTLAPLRPGQHPLSGAPLPGVPEQSFFLTDEVWIVNPEANCIHNWRSERPTDPANSLDL